jgi:hypothetical protein
MTMSHWCRGKTSWPVCSRGLEAGAGDLRRERAAVADREKRVFGAVQHQRRSADLAEPPAPGSPASIMKGLVGQLRGDVGGPVDDALGRRSHAVGVERAGVRGEGAFAR